MVTVEEAALAGGFGSAVLEAAADSGVETAHIRRLGIPDRFIEHAERGELLADLGLDPAGIARACRELASYWGDSTEVNLHSAAAVGFASLRPQPPLPRA